MAEKESHLNGAYYGPSIPPPTRRSYHRHSRRGGGTDCCCCLPCCLLNCFFQIIFTIVVVIGIIVLVVWLALRPSKVKFNVTDVTLTQFNLTGDNMLHYNFSLDMDIRNPNKRIGIYYDQIEARAFYNDQRFDSIFLTPFYQDHKNTTTLRAQFQGQNIISSSLTEFNNQKRDGRYNIDIKLYLRVRFKVSRIKTNKYKPKINCDLEVPSGSDPTIRFESTRCKIDY